MGNISLSKENLKYIRDAFSHFFPEDAVYSADKPYTSGEFNWDNRKEFIGFVYRLTGIQIKSEKDFENIKKAQLAVEELVEKEKKGPETNRPSKEQLETLEEEAKKRKETEQKAAKEAKENVEEALKKKEELVKENAQKEIIDHAKLKVESDIIEHQKIQENIQGKKIYAKVEISKEAPPPEESTVRFIKVAKSHPKSFEKDLAQSIKQKLGSTLTNKLSAEEIDVLASKTAIDTVLAINNFPLQSSANTQTAILGALAKDSKILPKILPDEYAIKLIKNASSDLSYFKNSTQLSKSILSSVNENLATSVFGTGPENLKVTFYDQPVEGYTHEVDVGQLNEGYTNLLGSQLKVFDNLSSITGVDIKGALTNQVKGLFDSQIAKLPADSTISGIYNSEFGQQVLSFAGFGETAPLGEGFLSGFIQQIPGASAFFEGLGNTFGIDFAVGAAAPATEIASTAVVATEGTALVEATVVGVEAGITAAGGAVVGVEAGVVAGTAEGVAVGTAAGATAGVAIGQVVIPIPVVGAAIGAAVSWVASKIPWKKVKEWSAAIIGGVAGLIALPFVGIGAAVAIGVGVAALAAAVGAGLGGLTIGAIGGGIAGFVGAISMASLAAVGMPILVTILAFPVVVAFILFMINSGAYIVPPTLFTTLSSNPYIQIDKVASPAGPFKNTDLPLKIDYTITVTAKKSALTNISFKNECQILTSGPSKSCPSETPTDIPDSISPSVPFTFTYSETYSGGDYQDSIVLDTFTVNADTLEETDQEVSGSASVSIGTPPTACLTIDENEWPSQYYANMVSARSVLVSKYSSYISKVCLSYTSLPLKYNPIGFGSYWGWNHGTYIDFFPLGVGNQDNALYTLSHELGHSLAWGSQTGYIFEGYRAFPGIKTEAPYCFYGATLNWNEGESLPESIALHIIEPRCGSVQQQWPIHYQFLMKYVFN